MEVERKLARALVEFGNPGWYLTSNGFIHPGDGMVVPFETQAEALAYMESLTES